MRILRPLCAEGLVVQSEVGVYTLTEHGMVFALPAYEDAAKFAYVTEPCGCQRLCLNNFEG